MTTRSHPSPVMELLLEERSNPSDALSWQLALGAVVDSLPWMGNEPFEPYASAACPMPRLPQFIVELWFRPYAPDQQIELGTPGFLRPTNTPVVQPSTNSRWFTLPALQEGACLQTTTGPWLGAPSVAAFGMEDSDIQTGPDWFDEMESRAITPIFDARIAEIDSPEAWVWLVERFPSMLDGVNADVHNYQHDLAHWFSGHTLYEPHWPSVAQHYGAIHLTQLAYVLCAYAPIPCLDGVTTITGWGPDVTVWLRHPHGTQ